MTTSKTTRNALAVSPLVVVPVAFLLLAPWLKAEIGSETTMLISAAAAIFVMGYAVYLSICHQRVLDEMQAAGGNFSARWAMSLGPIAFVTLLLLPPFLDTATAIIGDAAGTVANRKVVTLAMTFGFGSVVILQTIAMAIVNLLWWRARR